MDNKNVSDTLLNENVKSNDEQNESPKPNIFERIWSDLKQANLIWVKVIFFFQSASLVTLYPYLTLHMRQLGFTSEDVSIVFAIIPFIEIFGPPFAGYLADKMGNFRLFMSIVTFLNGAASLSLVWFPSLPQHEINCCTSSAIHKDFSNCTTGIENSTIQITEEDKCNLLNETFHYEGKNCSRYLCSDIINTDEANFWFYMGVRIIIDILRVTSIMQFEGAVMAILKEYGGDYGLQKIFATFGALLFGPLIGKLIDLSSGRFDCVFYTYFALRTVTALLILKLDLKFKPPAKKVWKNVFQNLFQLQVFAFLFAFLAAGTFWGFLETFLFWYLEDLGSSKLLMGLTLGVNTLTGFFVHIFSSQILKTLGHVKTVILSLTLYAIRFFGYAWMKQPYLALILEVLKPICTSLLTICAFNFVKKRSELTIASTVEGIFGAMYYGVGRGLGAFLGGFLFEIVGTFWTFIIFGISASVVVIIYIMLSAIPTNHKATNDP